MSLNLKVEVDENAGFCFGVTRAIEKAEEILNSGQELYCLGQIVHNLEEVKRLEKIGMISIEHSDLSQIRNKNVLIRSHGEPPETYRLLETNQNTIIEATCPIVFKLQKRVQKTNQNGDYVLIFGKAEHPEVVALTGLLKSNFQVVRSMSDLDINSLPQKITMYSQTTMEPEALNLLYSNLTEKGFDVDLKDTICKKVSGKRSKLESFAQRHDVIIMVAGEKSSNGQVLFEICKSINPRSFKVSRRDQVSNDWFNDSETVGITGATSTPEWQMQTMAEYLESI